MQYAGLIKRAVALIIDLFVITFMTFLVMGFLGFVVGGAMTNLEGLTKVTSFGPLIDVILIWLYYAGLESSEHQATVGKMVIGIYTTDLDGHRISFAKATIRHFSKYVSALILFVGYFMAGITPKKQALHDMMAGTLVLSR